MCVCVRACAVSERVFIPNIYNEFQELNAIGLLIKIYNVSRTSNHDEQQDYLNNTFNYNKKY